MVIAPEEQLNKSQEWADASNQLIDGVQFDTSSPRTRVAVSLLHLALEHQKGIHVLVGKGIGGSALALLRPQTEAYMRGVWYQWCATPAQIQEFIGGGEPPGFGALVNAVEKTPLFEKFTWLEFKKRLWPTLNDYTHGGYIQVMARNTKTEISSNFRPENMVNALQGAASISYLAGVAIALIANNPQLADGLTKLHQRIYVSHNRFELA